MFPDEYKNMSMMPVEFYVNTDLDIALDGDGWILHGVVLDYCFF